MRSSSFRIRLLSAGCDTCSAIRGAAEVQRLGERDDRLEIGEVDIHNRKLSDAPKRFTGRHRGSGATLEHEETHRDVRSPGRR